MSDEIQPDPGSGTIVHIGAGTGGDLAAHLATRPARVVLVEPNPDLLPELREVGRDTAGAADCEIEILGLAVAGKTGEAVLNVFNFFDLSSLAEPSGLTGLYPGLQTVERPLVQTVTLTDLLRRIELDPAGPNRLVIDAPGTETQIVRAATQLAAKAQFRQIVLRAPLQALYKGALTAEKLTAQLEGKGYLATRAATADTDPDWPEAHFELSAGNAELAALRDDLNKALRSKEQLSKALEREKQKTRTLSEAVEELTASLTEERQTTQAAVSTAEELRKRHDIAERLQFLTRTDLDDLRCRYRALRDEKARQQDLLSKLTYRLGGAAVYLHGLAGVDDGGSGGKNEIARDEPLTVDVDQGNKA